MLKYFIRLDDACPFMKREKWDRIESVLDKYGVKPIVGVIPDSLDEEFAENGVIDGFWEDYAARWQEKGWIIAQHGLHHTLSKTVRTEYAGKSYGEQKTSIDEGYRILESHGIDPVCFFAPAHTFDDNTVKACADSGHFKFISDGVAVYPYRYLGMMFMPNIFDTPHRILPFGVYTFIFHPNNMEEGDLTYLESFLSQNADKFGADPDEILGSTKTEKGASSTALSARRSGRSERSRALKDRFCRKEYIWKTRSQSSATIT